MHHGSALKNHIMLGNLTVHQDDHTCNLRSLIIWPYTGMWLGILNNKIFIFCIVHTNVV